MNRKTMFLAAVIAAVSSMHCATGYGRYPAYDSGHHRHHHHHHGRGHH